MITNHCVTNSNHVKHTSDDKSKSHSPISTDNQQHVSRKHFQLPQDSRTSSSAGSGATGIMSGGSQSSGGSKHGDGNGSSSSGGGKSRLVCSSAFNRGTRCSSSASSSTEETEAREKRFGSVDLHPLPSVALTAIMNQAIQHSLYADSSIQTPEQLQYATLLAAHKTYTDSSGQINIQLNTSSVQASTNDLVNLLSKTTNRASSNSMKSIIPNVSSQNDTPQLNQNFLLELFPPNLWSRLICPVHADTLLAQISYTLSNRNNEVNEGNSETLNSLTTNQQSSVNIPSASTLHDNGSANSIRQPTDTTAVITGVSGTQTGQYPTSMTDSNSSNNNNIQSNGPQRIGPYYLGPTLGRGNFAVVKLGKHSQLAVKVAIKIMNKDLIGSKNLGKVSRELEAMKRCQHPHIIRLYHVMETESNIFMVTEYASKGEVFDHISLSHAFTEKEARELFWQIVCAIEFCHNSGIVHRDLKAENLLLDSDFKIKVADFGFCNFFQNDQLLSTHCGSPQYAAPELFKGEPYDGTLADVWSLGVILYILVCGSFPFPGESLGDIRTQVLRGLVRFPFYLSTACEYVIRCMLQVDPTRRFKLKQVMTTAWMQESPNVEHYKSLMNKYQIHAKERQFEILFHHQHPEHSKIAKEEYLERVERKLDIGIIRALSNEAGLDEEQIRQSTIQRKYDRYHAAYELLKDKIEFFYHNPILRKFVNDQIQKEINFFAKPQTIERQSQRLSSQSSIIIGDCSSRGEQAGSNSFNLASSSSSASSSTTTAMSAQLPTVLDVLDETMLEGRNLLGDLKMSSDCSNILDVQMKDNSYLISDDTIVSVNSTTSRNTVMTLSNPNKSVNICFDNTHNGEKGVDDMRMSKGSNLKEWKSASQPKNTELNAAVCILKADEDEILSHFGIDPTPINKLFSSSTRRHTLQFANSLFHKPSHHRDNLDNILINNDDDDDGDESHKSTANTTTAAMTNISSVTMNPKTENIHEQTDASTNNQVISFTDCSSTKRTPIRRFPRQITQPHANRLQYNQNNSENSDQMLLNRLDWMLNTWETTQSEFKKPLMIQSKRPYLNKISKQNDETLTSLELGQEAATTKLPVIESDPVTSKTTLAATNDDDDDQDDVSIIINQVKRLPEIESIQLMENIPLDYSVSVMDKPNIITGTSISTKAEYPNSMQCSYESASRSQLDSSDFPNLPTNLRDALLGRIPEQISVDMNTDSNKTMDITGNISIEKPSMLENSCWSTAHISDDVDEDEDDNACDPAAGVLGTLLPQLNLPANLPAMIHQPVACFTVKDPNLLAPPEFMTPHSSSFPRRSSDGAADLQPLHRPVITVGGSYPEQANYRKESSGAGSENSSLAVINPVRPPKPESTEGVTPSVNVTNLSDWVRTSRPRYDKTPSNNSDLSKQSSSTAGQLSHESRSRSLAAQQRSLFTALHSHKRRLPLGLWWKLTHKKFNQTGEDFKSELWKAQFIRHQKRFSLPVNCGPVRRPSDTVKRELQCKCHQPLTSELLQEIKEKLNDASWFQKSNVTEITVNSCSTTERQYNLEDVPEIYRRGSEASQMTAWEQRLRQYSDLYNPGTHTQIGSSLHQPVAEIETDDDMKLTSHYSLFSSPFTDESFISSTAITKDTHTNPITETIRTTRTPNTGPQLMSCKTQFILDSVKEDNSLRPAWNEPFESHANTANVSPISQSGIELTDLKTELHKLEVESNTMESKVADGMLISSTDLSKSVDDYGIHRLNDSTHLPKFMLSSETSNIPSFLSDQAINIQQSTLPIKYIRIPNEQSPSTSSSVYWSHRVVENGVHRRASSVVGAPIESSYLVPSQDLLEKPEDRVRRHRHSVGEMFDDKIPNFDYEYCSGIDPNVFSASSEFQPSSMQTGVNLNSDMIHVSPNDGISIKSLSSFSTSTTLTGNNSSNTGIGQRLFDRLRPERTNYLHILQHQGGSLDRRLNPDFLRSPRRKIYQEWLPKLTELSRKAFDAARDKVNKVKTTNNPQSLVCNLVHSDILYPTSCYVTSNTNPLPTDRQDKDDGINTTQTDQVIVDQKIHNEKNIITTGFNVTGDNPVDIVPEPDVDQDIDEEEDDEKDCALAPLKTHVAAANVQSIHYPTRPRHRTINQSMGQNLGYPQQVMPFFHGNLRNSSTIQQHQSTCIPQMPMNGATLGGYGLQDLVDFSNPQALPAAAAAASLLLFRSTDDDDDLAAIDRVNQRIALSRLTGNFSDTSSLIDEYPNVIGGTLTPPQIPQPQPPLLSSVQPNRSLPVSQPIHRTQLSHSTVINQTKQAK
ncbi:unnamed protein product [Heterobilharzia americana]|nr:unnamed protein product [Heterobilharzia americana]